MRIIADWRRFACGLWRLPEGDISAAYCADIFPKLKIFTHEGRVYMNGGSFFSGAVRTTCSCHPLIPSEEYRGPKSVRYSYEGKEGHYKGTAFRLGPKILFVSSDPTIDEWTQLFRVMFADGGMFTHGVTYPEFLQERLSPKTPSECSAQALDLELCRSNRMPETQDEMRGLLEGAEITVPLEHQLELVF